MDLTLSTPGLLFASISLLLLAYTNRFLALASLIRNLIASYETHPRDSIPPQISNLRIRIVIIQYMQALGILSFFFCVLSMAFLFFNNNLFGQMSFGISLILLMASLLLSFIEISLSVRALIIQMDDITYHIHSGK
ncbi:MAG: DUF2721 domain-containing protein [Candidatus Margulisiibacteriota bacterium]|nr:MAG: II family cellulose-binding protein [Candidatus Margulisbacteria bacterium GWD2_39_127]OGI07286.1 MAG: II family cellulose-binding protein [Candidatus Margulisbacteria bacterium GWE2_39_32]PZM83953.1 MAG: DUF2721 domain-containing protein [Candidatus Margulisiibacteriota bacterium]HAR62910.1 DUF2721 domain-containing protein [Candidatus Margulisiibacteriota bacterium]HCT86355.1 DUF2721 domain-containing protein [Candidatus Margulisiibacteriota bacterium]